VRYTSIAQGLPSGLTLSRLAFIHSSSLTKALSGRALGGFNRICQTANIRQPEIK
jgi:hypothetical protein